jgi:predicted dehydrogenase
VIGVGIIGAGEFAHKHARAIITNSSTVLIAACRRNEVELNNFIKKYNIIGYSDYNELLKNKNIDAVVICTPHHMHHQIAADAAKAGQTHFA